MLHSSLKDKAHQDTLDSLTETALFKSFPSGISTSILAAVSLHEYSKNEMLFVQHDMADWVYLVVSGWVKLFRETQDGDEAVIELAGKGSFIGETAVFEGNIHSFHAEVTEKTVLLRIPLSLLKQAVETSHPTALVMLDIMASKRQQQTQELESLKLQNAPQRIGCFLLRQCEGQESGSRDVTLPYGKSLIATQLGMKGETFSRALAKLKQTTGTKVSNNHITVPNITELAQFVCSGCSNEYPCNDLLKSGLPH